MFLLHSFHSFGEQKTRMILHIVDEGAGLFAIDIALYVAFSMFHVLPASVLTRAVGAVLSNSHKLGTAANPVWC